MNATSTSVRAARRLVTHSHVGRRPQLGGGSWYCLIQETLFVVLMMMIVDDEMILT